MWGYGRKPASCSAEQWKHPHNHPLCLWACLRLMALLSVLCTPGPVAWLLKRLWSITFCRCELAYTQQLIWAWETFSDLLYLFCALKPTPFKSSLCNFTCECHHQTFSPEDLLLCFFFVFCLLLLFYCFSCLKYTRTCEVFLCQRLLCLLRWHVMFSCPDSSVSNSVSAWHVEKRLTETFLSLLHIL